MYKGSDSCDPPRVAQPPFCTDACMRPNCKCHSLCTLVYAEWPLLDGVLLDYRGGVAVAPGTELGYGSVEAFDLWKLRKAQLRN